MCICHLIISPVYVKYIHFIQNITYGGQKQYFDDQEEPDFNDQEETDFKRMINTQGANFDG